MRRILGVAAALALTMAPAALAQQVGNGMYGIKIAVKDFQKTIDFYALLGMKMGPKHNAAEWELKWDNPAQGSNISTLAIAKLLMWLLRKLLILVST